MGVRFVAAARSEFLAEVAYYRDKAPGLGARFVVAVEDAMHRATAFPSAGPAPGHHLIQARRPGALPRHRAVRNALRCRFCMRLGLKP